MRECRDAPRHCCRQPPEEPTGTPCHPPAAKGEEKAKRIIKAQESERKARWAKEAEDEAAQLQAFERQRTVEREEEARSLLSKLAANSSRTHNFEERRGDRLLERGRALDTVSEGRSVRGPTPGDGRLPDCDGRLLDELERRGVEYSVSVPFARFADLKAQVEDRCVWWRAGKDVAFFEPRWKPAGWDCRRRVIVVRRRVPARRKGPLQLDLFEPREDGFEFKAVVTNKRVRAGAVALFHEGRGA